MKHAITMFSGLAAFAALAGAPQITEVAIGTIDPENPRLSIAYRLDRPAAVTLEVLTNGVSIGDEHVTRLTGDVNRWVTNTACSILWLPAADWLGEYRADGTLTARLTAWPAERLPDYMAVNLAVSNDVRFYATAAAIPGGVSNRLMQTHHLLMRRIPAAGTEWRMGGNAEDYRANGCNPGAPNVIRERPRLVTFTEDYYLGVFEVTQGQFAYWGTARATFNSGAFNADEAAIRPMESVSYNLLRGVPPVYDWPVTGHAVTNGCPLDRLRKHSGIEFDLPTDAQWEFACRAGTLTSFYDGASRPDAIGWYGGNGTTIKIGSVTYYISHPVGLKAPNAFGLYDMTGNVSEWCLDWIDGTASLPYAMNVDPEGVTNPGGTLTGRVNRGGNCSQTYDLCRSCRRSNDPAHQGSYAIGFRLCCPAKLPAPLTPAVNREGEGE